MSKADSIIESAKSVQATKAEGALREAAVDALKRAGLPKDLIERTKTLPGTPFEHAPAFAKLPDADRANLRKAFRTFANFPVGDFDRLTAPAGRDSGDGRAGRPVKWNDPDPWPDPVDGAELIDALMRVIVRYAELPAGGAVAVALWTLYTWAFKCFSVSPNLMVTAPERGSGKTQLMGLISWAVPRPFPVSDTTAATIFRIVEHETPTLLFDEAQAVLKRRNPDDPTKAILLGSFSKRFAFVPRTNKDTGEVRLFSTFAPKAMSGLNLAGIDDAFTSRCIVIPMMRATHAYPEMRIDRDPVSLEIRRKCARWAADYAAALREADPDMCGRVGRSAQPWRPLFAVADAIGGPWSKQAREAADALSAVAGAFASGESLGVMLLADVWAVFDGMSGVQRIKSKNLDKALQDLPERPWNAMPKSGQPITPQARGRMLAEFGIHSKTLQFDDGKAAKGYERTAFVGAWTAYLSDDNGSRTVAPSQPSNTSESASVPNVTGTTTRNGSDRAETPANSEVVTAQRFGNQDPRENGTESAPAPVSLPSATARHQTTGDEYRRARDGE